MGEMHIEIRRSTREWLGHCNWWITHGETMVAIIAYCPWCGLPLEPQ